MNCYAPKVYAIIYAKLNKWCGVLLTFSCVFKYDNRITGTLTFAFAHRDTVELFNGSNTDGSFYCFELTLESLGKKPIAADLG